MTISGRVTVTTVIQKVMMFICGFSCQSVSALNSNRSKFRKCVASDIGSTGNAARMALDYIGKYRPLFVFLENVAGFLHSQVAEQDQSNFEFLRNQLWDLGYSVILLRVNPLDMGYPQRRRRIFIVGVLSSFMHQDWVCVI